MFEGKLPKAAVGHAASHGLEADFGDGDALRPMTWSDLRTRLEAARDLRETLRAQSDSELASFDACSARRIAAQAESKEPVNLEDSANGKTDGCIDCASQNYNSGSARGL